ncbi:regenerating islet-derived protein 4 isoform X1 [Drosophila willistoni]|uniref:regenerating islet-derived protein 4 isoform X1 n=1 Tax=Drosophila willistoni TaxID=7260 RepID=UPI001F082AED|nr:regenerating islet-derived protein 4 isoform X1 [Drosophila willistoni]
MQMNLVGLELLLVLVFCLMHGNVSKEPEMQKQKTIKDAFYIDRDERYFLARKRTSWFNALAMCRSYQLELASFPNEDDFKAFHKYLTTYYPQMVTTKSRLWIGARHINNNWHWLSTYKIFTFTKWQGEPPKTEDDPGEICVRSNVAGWTGTACNRNHYYICEKKPN